MSHHRLVKAAMVAGFAFLWLPILLRMRLRYTRHRNLMESYREHKAVVDALRRGDRKAAARALAANIQ